MTPGLPREANKYADRVGRVMNYGDGLYGGMFFAGMYAAAFFESDPEKVVGRGCCRIPAGSGYAKVIADVLAWYAKNPDDWKKTWQARHRRLGQGRPLPGRRARARSTSTPSSTAPRWPWACSTATATSRRPSTSRPAPGRTPTATRRAPLGILGVILGYERIPDVWKAGIPRIATTRFGYTSPHLRVDRGLHPARAPSR